jgi:hypothetical protein
MDQNRLKEEPNPCSPLAACSRSVLSTPCSSDSQLNFPFLPVRESEDGTEGNAQGEARHAGPRGNRLQNLIIVLEILDLVSNLSTVEEEICSSVFI